MVVTDADMTEMCSFLRIATFSFVTKVVLRSIKHSLPHIFPIPSSEAAAKSDPSKMIAHGSNTNSLTNKIMNQQRFRIVIPAFNMARVSARVLTSTASTWEI